MKRRALLFACGTAAASAASATAGCLSAFDADDEYDEIRLGLVTVNNRSEREQTVDVVLRRDGETVSWTRHRIRRRSSDVVYGDRIGCLLDEPAGAYRILARLDRTGETYDFPLTPNSRETRDVSVAVTEAGEVGLMGPAGPADEERCRSAATLDGQEGGETES